MLSAFLITLGPLSSGCGFLTFKQLQRIVFRNTRRRDSFRGGRHVYNKLRWAFLWTWGRGSKIIAFTRVRKIGLTKKVVVHRTLLIIIRGVVCCRAGGMVGLLARGIEHKARGGRTQISTSSKTTEMLEEVIWNQPRSQGSLLPALRSSLSLRRAGRREPWERGWYGTRDCP